MNKNFIKTVILSLVIAFSLAPCQVKEITGTGGGGTPTPTVSTTALQQIISNGNLAGLVSNTDPLVTTTLSHLTGSANYTANTEIVAIYATETGAGNQSGNHWTNAIAAANLRNKITNITDATASKVYAVLVAGGTYKPTYDGDRNISFAMKNHVAVIGGFAAAGSWEMSGTTTFSGDLGTVGSTNDNTYNVFRHHRDPLNNAVLYGVTISGGNADGDNSIFFLRRGGGMYNNANSSPRLINVVFTGNNATYYGGGMYNIDSSPLLLNVVFSGNNARSGGGIYSARSQPVLTGVVFTGNNSSTDGGGMFNDSSSPVLTGVVFTGNSARSGGGMYNNADSFPQLINVVFTGNSARSGGGMYNNADSSPQLINVVFTGNSASTGGAMYNDNDASAGPLMVNTIFAGNTATVSGNDITMNLNNPDGETIRIAGSVLGITLANPTNGIGIVGIISGTGDRPLNLTYHGLSNGAVNFGTNATTGGLTYPTILGTSSAKDLGLYVRRSGTDYYFSDTGTAWYTNFIATGGFGPAVPNLPAGAEDLTARDIAGNLRVGRPDAGVYEVQTP